MHKKYRKYLILVTIAVTVTFICGELFARYYLGLGTPPLLVTHPTIEYLLKPDQDVYRFGNRIVVNHYGMRSLPFAAHAADELRIMVFGDSVLNGGGQTDHASLATTILQERLAYNTGQKVVVGNISAGSWGPGNWLAYAKEYGFFDANAVVLIISSHDYADNPSFQPLDETTHPTKRPVLALTEGITRYLPRYLPQFARSRNQGETDRFSETFPEDAAKKGLEDLKDFLVLAKNNSKLVMVFQYWEREEIKRGKAKIGNKLIQEVCESIGISPIQLMPYFKPSIESGNAAAYRDNIHPSQIGQELIAKALLEHLPNQTLERTR